MRSVTYAMKLSTTLDSCTALLAVLIPYATGVKKLLVISTSRLILLFEFNRYA